jgi:hypothetical protein
MRGMVGAGSLNNSVDIPLGNVYGLGYTWKKSIWPWAEWRKEWFLGLIRTGLNGMNRQPEHQ